MSTITCKHCGDVIEFHYPSSEGINPKWIHINVSLERYKGYLSCDYRAVPQTYAEPSENSLFNELIDKYYEM